MTTLPESQDYTECHSLHYNTTTVIHCHVTHGSCKMAYNESLTVTQVAVISQLGLARQLQLEQIECRPTLCMTVCVCAHRQSEVSLVCLMDTLSEMTGRGFGQSTLLIQQVYDPTGPHLH